MRVLDGVGHRDVVELDVKILMQGCEIRSVFRRIVNILFYKFTTFLQLRIDM